MGHVPRDATSWHRNKQQKATQSQRIFFLWDKVPMFFFWKYSTCPETRPWQAWGCCLMSDQGQKLRSGIKHSIFLPELGKEGNRCQFSPLSYLPSMLRMHISSSSKKWLGHPRVSMSLNPSQGTCQTRQGVMHSTTESHRTSPKVSKPIFFFFLIYERS